MTLRQLAHDWLPPKMRNALVRRFMGVRAVPQWPASVPGGWAAAAAEAAKGHAAGLRQLVEGTAVGYAPEDSLLDVSGGSKQSHDRLVQLAFVTVRAAMGRDRVRILDYGGGYGLHALALTRLLPLLQIDYTVCELDAFCDIGNELNPRVRFVARLNSAGNGYDLVYASSSVQYSEDWRALVAALCSASTTTLFITRTPFIFGAPTFVSLQRAYKTEYPGWVFNYEEFVSEFPRHGFELRETFVNGPGIPVRGAKAPNVHLGLLFERAVTVRGNV